MKSESSAGKQKTNPPNSGRIEQACQLTCLSQEKRTEKFLLESASGETIARAVLGLREGLRFFFNLGNSWVFFWRGIFWLGVKKLIHGRLERENKSEKEYIMYRYWRMKWQPTPVLLPGIFHGWRNLAGYSPWGRKESDATERLYCLSFYSSFWRRKWQPTPVFLPGESHGQRSLVGYSLWGRKESDTTKQLTHTHTHTHTHRYLNYMYLYNWVTLLWTRVGHD